MNTDIDRLFALMLGSFFMQFILTLVFVSSELIVLIIAIASIFCGIVFMGFVTLGEHQSSPEPSAAGK